MTSCTRVILVYSQMVFLTFPDGKGWVSRCHIVFFGREGNVKEPRPFISWRTATKPSQIFLYWWSTIVLNVGNFCWQGTGRVSIYGMLSPWLTAPFTLRIRHRDFGFMHFFIFIFEPMPSSHQCIKIFAFSLSSGFHCFYLMRSSSRKIFYLKQDCLQGKSVPSLSF